MGLLSAPEKIYDGATSLVDIIIKKWGDDAAGAAKELEEKVGFPESVANRIATGELPMDAESVARRVDEQGYGDVVYRGINGEYDPDKAGYYQMFTTSEQDAAEYGGNVLEARLNLGDNAVVDGRGRNFNSIPAEDGLLVRTDDLAHESREAGRDSLTIRNIHDKADNEIPRRPSASNTGPSDEEIMRELGLDYSPSPNASPAPDARNYDPVDVDVVFDPSRIRSPNAAYDPQYTGSNIMGGAAGTAGLAGLLAAGQSEESEAGFITKGGRTLLEAWHGSPHKFDKFSMDQIGTGEGAQMYGHGLYFADSEDVARGYRDGLAGSDGYYKGQRIADMGLPTENDEVGALSYATSLLRDGFTDDVRADTLDYFKDDLDTWIGYRSRADNPPEVIEHLDAEIASKRAAYDAAKKIDYSDLDVSPNGHLYRTEIDVTPESLLDWDRPLSEQSEAVRNAVQDIASNGDARFTDQQLSKLNEALLSTESGNNRGQSIIGILGDDYSVDPRAVDSAYSAAARSFKEYDYPYETALEDIKGAYPDAKPEELEWALKKEYGIGGRAGASSAFLDRGIKGIKYHDGETRGLTKFKNFDDWRVQTYGNNPADDISESVQLQEYGNYLDGFMAEGAEESHNYVIFDDGLINIAERGNADPRLLAGTAAGTAGLLAAPVLMGERGQPTTPEERGFKSWEEVSRDPTAPLPAPTWGEAMGKAGSNLMYVLGLPMTGLQGIARGGYGLLTGEDLTELAAQAGNTMDVRWKNGLLDVSQMNPDKGADQAGAYVAEKTGDESLGWMAKMGLMFGGL